MTSLAHLEWPPTAANTAAWIAATSAFKRPAEPVEEPDPWVEGDVVFAENNDGKNAWLYVRGKHFWNPGRALTKGASHGHMAVSDEAMDRYIAGGPKVNDNFTVIRRGGKAVQA